MRRFPILLVLLLTGCAASIYDMETRRALSLTPADFASTITSQGDQDQLSEYIQISTERGFQRKTGIARDIPTGFDYHLRGRIHKKTGERTYQVYVKWEHGGDWFHPRQAVFGDPFQIAEITLVSKNRDCDTECYFTEEFVFDVPESALRKVYDRGMQKIDLPEGMLPREFLDNNKEKLGFTYRIITDIGFYPAALVLSQEIIAFLDTMDRMAKNTQNDAPAFQ